MSKLFGKNKDNSRLGALRPALTLIILVLMGVLLFTGEVSVELQDRDVTVKSFMFSEKISLDDVASLELRENFDKGRRIFGVGGMKISSGNFSNQEFGAYRLCVYSDVAACIVARSGDRTVVFNQKTAEETRALYSSLKERLNR